MDFSAFGTTQFLWDGCDWKSLPRRHVGGTGLLRRRESRIERWLQRRRGRPAIAQARWKQGPGPEAFSHFGQQKFSEQNPHKARQQGGGEGEGGAHRDGDREES